METTLTVETYHDRANSLRWVSCSQIKRFAECEALALAEVKDDWKPATEDESDSEALLVGNYVDVALLTPELMPKFKIERAGELFKKDGKPYAHIVMADRMIAVARACPTISKLLHGEKQKIVLFELDGVPAKAMLDVAIAEQELIIDLKTCGDLEEQYSAKNRRKIPYYEANGYWLNAAIYIEAMIQNGWANPVMALAAITKQKPPNKGVVVFTDPVRLEQELTYAKGMAKRIALLKTGDLKPDRCGNCVYCRSTKVIEGYETAKSLVPANQFDRKSEITTETEK